jgi:dTDP-4-amino-4,6-dideoxygalactose transaminase
LIPRLKPYLNHKELLSAIIPSIGAIPKFEKEFANKFGREMGTMFSHGRTALYSLLKVWELTNIEVICPAYTCVVVPHAIHLSGNIPVFVDSCDNGFNMDLEILKNTIGPKTRAVIVTHLFGCAMDVIKINKIITAKEKEFGNKIYIIQDVAHSFGAKWDGELVTKYGDAAFFGLNISKILTSVFGGIAIYNDCSLEKKLKKFRKENMHFSFLKGFKRLSYLIAIFIAFSPTIYSFINWLERKGLLNSFTVYYNEEKIDMPSDWDILPCALEARVGLTQLKKYDKIVELRNKAAITYSSQLKENNEINVLDFPTGSTYSHFVGLVENRQKWLENYAKKGIQLGILIEYSCPHMKAYEYRRKEEYPNSLNYSKKTINIPNWPGIDFKNIL